MESEEESDDEEEYRSLRPIPSCAYYDRYEKIRKANLELSREVQLESRPHPAKVRFNDDVTYEEEEEEEEDPLEGEVMGSPAQEAKSTPTKVLLVTVPTGFSQESEEVASESEESEDHGPTTNPPADAFREEEIAVPGVWEQVDPEEEVEESGSSRQDTLESSTETVICGEESDRLTEWFSRSINLEEEQEPLAEEVHRPSTAFSVKVQRRREEPNKPEVRPSTAPVRRHCCLGGHASRLPNYNGLRSEYGLSAEQLRERERRKKEIADALKMEKEQKYLEHKKKMKENEKTFNNWLIRKKREAEAKAIRRLRQSNYCFRTIPAPTAHLDKIGILRRKMLRKENTCFLLNEIFKNAKPHEQKTYRIYLGLRAQ